MSNKELHKKSSTVRDVILGGQDGLVNVLGIVLGITAAGGTKQVLIAASLAAAFAGAVSMAAVNYTSTHAQRDYYEKEMQRETVEIEKQSDHEKQEVRAIFEEKGFSSDILDRIVATITSNKKQWVNIMMQDELKLQPVETKKIIPSSLVVGLATIIGSLVPIVSFFIFPEKPALYIGIVLSCLVLFFAGVYKAKSLVGVWWKSGIQMVLIGIGAAIIGFFIGKIFHTV